MDEFWKKRNKPSAAQLTGALGESVKEYLKKTELPGEKAAVTLNSFYPADAGTLVRTLEEIGGPEKRWSWQGGQAEDKTGYGGPAAQRQGQSGKGGWGQSGEPGFEQKVALVQQALQRDREAHRRQEGNHYTAGNTAGRGSGSFGGGNLSGESFPGAGAGGVPGGAAVSRSRPAFPTAGQGGAGQGAFHFPRTLPQDGRFESGRLNVPERSGVFGQGGAPRLPGWNEAQRVPVTYGPGQQWPQQAPYGMEQQREGERWQPPERSAPHTLPQPWEQREPQPVEPPQGGAATEPSRLALYGPQEQEKMLRLLREKGLQTLLSGDTLEERNDGGQALLRLARLGTDENAKASEGQDEGTEYEPLFRKGGLPTKEIISQGNKRENPNYQEKDWWLEKINQEKVESPLERLAEEEGASLDIARGVLGLLTGAKAAEADLILQYPLDALQVREAKNKAELAKAIAFPQEENPDKEVDGSRVNAFLHAFWNAGMAYRIGTEKTEKFATAHETYTQDQYEGRWTKEEILNKIDPDSGLTTGQNVEMDMYNNEIGRQIAEKMPETEEQIHQQLLYRYGSEEEVAQELERFPGFSQADLLLFVYTKDALEAGQLMWLYEGKDA